MKLHCFHTIYKMLQLLSALDNMKTQSIPILRALSPVQTLCEKMGQSTLHITMFIKCLFSFKEVFRNFSELCFCE